MSHLVYTPSPSGLLLATHGADERSAAAALRQHDPDLRLVPQDSDHFGKRIYKVYRYKGSETEAEFVCGWWDELGNPLPLSVTGLLDLVQRLDKNTRGGVQDVDIHNEELKASRQRANEAGFDAILEEHKDRVDGKKSSPLPRSRSLQLARARERARHPGSDLHK